MPQQVWYAWVSSSVTILSRLVVKSMLGVERFWSPKRELCSDRISRLPMFPSLPIIAPSELLLLDTIRASGENRIRPRVFRCSEINAADQMLGRRLLLVALLSDQKMGYVSLDLQKTRRLLWGNWCEVRLSGLCEIAFQWPRGCLEANVRAIVGDLPRGKETMSVSRLVYSLLQKDSCDPHECVLELVAEGLAARSLLHRVKANESRIAQRRTYTVPEATFTLHDWNHIGAVRELLEESERNFPLLWSCICTEIEQAILARKFLLGWNW